MSAIVVSSHLDDGILSCAAAVQDCAALVTVFAGIPGPDIPLGQWDRLTGTTDSPQRVRDRRAEDVAALAVLSSGRAEAVHLDFLDEQYRSGQPTSDNDMVEQLVAACSQADQLFVPAAIGRHPDHLATREAALLAAGRLGLPVTLYADIPYSLPYGWCQDVAGEADPAFLDRSWLFRQEFLDAGLDPRAWRLVTMPLSSDLAIRKLAAVSAYRSQLPVLDQGRAGMVTRPDVLAFEARWVAR